MKILAQENEESVLCVLPTGQSIEVTMLVVEGEECRVHNDVQEVANIFANNQKLIRLFKK